MLYHLPFSTALRTAADMGIEAVELPVYGGNPFVDLEDALEGGWRQLSEEVERVGLRVSALSNHQEGQLLLDHRADTDPVFAGNPEAKTRFAARRLVATAELAQRLDVNVVCAFTGCEDHSRWFPWPLENGYERMAPAFRDRLLPILDEFDRRDVRLALECHPRQFAYNLETARWALELVDGHHALGFNFDPANLRLGGIDPVAFIAELGDRILHVHAKDCEVVAHHAARSGLLAHGAWNRRGRGFRFRVPGWGEMDWRRIISELQVASYHGVLAVEHEDPTMSRIEGLRQAVEFLKPLLLRDSPEAVRWW